MNPPSKEVTLRAIDAVLDSVRKQTVDSQEAIRVDQELSMDFEWNADRANAQVKALQLAAQSLSAAITAHIRHVQDRANAITLIYQLPPEVFTIIIESALPHASHSKYYERLQNFRLVSRIWDKAITDCPIFWTSVRDTMPPNLLPLALARSKALPFTVSNATSDWIFSNPTFHGHLHRLKGAHITVPNRGVVMCNLGQLPATNLEQLAFHADERIHLDWTAINIVGDIPHLRQLWLTECMINRDSTLWSGLHKLSLHSLPEAFSASLLLEILDQCVLLESLRIVLVYLQAPKVDQPPLRHVHMPHLQSLSLIESDDYEYGPLLRHIDAPNCKWYSIHSSAAVVRSVMAFENADSGVARRMKRLASSGVAISLAVVDAEHWEPDLMPSRRYGCSLIQLVVALSDGQLSFRLAQDNPGETLESLFKWIVSTFDLQTTTTPINFEIYGRKYLPREPSEILNFVFSLPSIAELRIGSAPVTLFNGLMQRLSTTVSEDGVLRWHWPSLQSLSIVMDDDRLLSSILEMVRSRYGKPQVSLTEHFSKSWKRLDVKANLPKPLRILQLEDIPRGLNTSMLDFPFTNILGEYVVRWFTTSDGTRASNAVRRATILRDMAFHIYDPAAENARESHSDLSHYLEDAMDVSCLDSPDMGPAWGSDDEDSEEDDEE